MEATMERFAEGPDIHGLRRRLEDGTYQIASEEVAEAIMEWHMSPELLLRRAGRRSQISLSTS